jgi:hypothetical protein
MEEAEESNGEAAGVFFFFKLFTGNVSSTKQSDEPEQATALIPLHG